MGIFSLNQERDNLNLRVQFLDRDSNCNFNMGQKIGKSEYVGAYASSLESPNAITLLVPSSGNAKMAHININECKTSSVHFSESSKVIGQEK